MPIRRAELEALPLQPFSIPRLVGVASMPVTLVCGPPAAGKTTYVPEHAKPGDVIIELDACIEAAGGRR